MLEGLTVGSMEINGHDDVGIISPRVEHLCGDLRLWTSLPSWGLGPSSCGKMLFFEL